ncbi:MAG TPA: PD-(D/E)XK nuclease family protein [Solirubrobacteraceae bacterium]|jgi:ATP-dependent helicase/DNAse subunit B|nr:PD-(D/E)XK nuclease family protein [Solirubrobacteraceae bacterium]
MPLTLVTGPANAEKARFVLDGVHAALDREPILVVPTAQDVDRYRRELAERVVFGARVETFERLLDEVARRAGVAGVPLGPLARERLAVAAARDARLDALAASASTPGFAAAACRLFDELEEDRVAPDRFARALRAWAGDHAGRRRYGAELAGLYRAYRERLAALGRRDERLHHAAALDALREAPGRWGATPVLFYGFDDLQPLQRDAILALARTDAEVTVSLTHERGRRAFAARGQAVADLQPHADRHVELPPRAQHYAEGSREALHHLEREVFEEPGAAGEALGGGDQLTASLFDDVAARGVTPGDLAGVAAGDAVRFLEGGGERAELELVAGEAARLIAEEGFAAEEIAVVLRRPHEAAALVAQVFEACGVPAAVEQHTTLAHTALGRGLVGLLRAATGGSAADLLAWLRTPGVVHRAHLVDRLEGDVRRTGARSADEARALWREWPLEALDRVAAAHARGPAALLDRLGAELAGLFAAPHRRAAPVLDGGALPAAAALKAGRRALDDLADLARADPRLVPDPAELAAVLERVAVPVGARAVPGAVTVADPLSLRARRVRALFASRLVEGAFPAPAQPEPFLDDDERRRLNAATRALRLRVDDDPAGAERYLFYATLSRPEARLYLSWHTATDAGDPAVRSPFVDDVAALFADAPLERRARRDLGAVAWPAGAAPTERERARDEAVCGPRFREPVAAPLRHPEVLAALRERPSWSASALETWAGCPVKWFVERILRPEEIEPDPEQLVRGNLAHKVLERALRRLVDGGGLTPDRLPEARAAVREALGELSADVRISVDPARRRALEHRLEADLLRYVEAAARSGSSYVPARFEERFTGLEIGDGVLVDGTIDRIDVRGDQAILYDYKGKTATPAAKWLDEHRFQLAVYALAARKVLGLEPVGALYQPLGAPDLRPRGALLDGADPELVSVERDRRSAEELDELLEEAVAAALDAAREARDGRLEPRPDSCAWDGGCAYPTICRCEATA